MSHNSKQEHPEKESGLLKKRKSLPKIAKKKADQRQLSSFSEVYQEADRVDPGKPKAFEEYVALFEAIRKLKDLTNNQIEDFFRLMEKKTESVWIPFLTKLATNLCQVKCENDAKLISEIRTICKKRFEEYGILESGLTNAEKNLCLLCDGEYVIQFLREAQKQNEKHEKQIPNGELACLAFICFSLYCKNSYDGDTKIQLLIDRAVAEYFSAYALSGVREKDLAGKTLGAILSSKVFSPKKISEITYLYSGTTNQIQEQKEAIKRLEEIRRNQSERIAILSDENKAINTRNCELQDEITSLKADAQRLSEEREAAENMLEYEKNKFAKHLKTQEAGLAEQLTADITLELQALRDLIEYLNPDDQKRFRRRLDRIDRCLQEFGGE